LTVDPTAYAEELRALRATFVTLTLNTQLRGCIGSLEACRPLVLDIVRNAFAAAFRDPRFQPVSDAELNLLELHLSLLTAPVPIAFSSEADLRSQIVPNEDGLILADGSCRGTFLPSVWNSLPDPGDFLEQLKVKAGLTRGHWSDSIRAWRYRAEVIGDT
jgi:AmmeMemoRadiSam system protein A